MILDEFFSNNINLDSLDSFLVVLGGIFIVFIFIILIIAIILYIFKALALQELAKKNNIPNPWLAWIPVADMYLLGKLGFEIYAPLDKKNTAFTWVLFGCSLATVVLADSALIGLVNIASVVFSTWAYYYIFNKINPKNSILFTVLTAIFSIGGIILYFNRKNFTNETVEVTEKEEIKKEKKEEHVKFCSYCGNKLNKTSKFCNNCGQKI